MFYAHFVLSKKGPLAKVWLAAHWDKKLTKAHVFETDVEKTVDDIISPKVKMALRTSGHLLLGVVRIYSRKQKYLIQDLGEACAKIKMAFRPGIVDLPIDGAVANSDTITLPEIFHDFETAVADLGSIDLEEQFMMHRSRAEDITLRDDAINNGMLLPTDDFQSMENEFGGMLEDIEIPRRASTLQDHSQLGDTSQINLPAETTGDNLMETDKQSHVLDEQGLDRAGFGGGFGDGFGDFGQFGLQEDLLNASNMPQLDELNFEASGLGQPESDQQAKDNEEPMEVDRPAPAPRVPEESLREEEGFILEPIDVSGIKVRQRRKRKLIVDKEMELKGDFIRAQLQDHSDTLQVKCFPPPTKKALLWKESASVEQLYHNPTMHGVTSVLSNLITRNLRSLNTADLKIDTSLLKDIEVPRDDVPLANSTIEDSLIPITDMPLDPPVGDMLDEMKEAEFDLDHRDNMDDQLLPLTSTNALEQDLEGEDARISRVIPELPDLEGDAENEQDKDQLTATTEEQSGEAGEERRWNKRTQQVLRMLEKCFNQTDSLHFNDLTRKCSRKQAASRFYSCLLLAKEGAIQFQQDQPYSDIVIEQGPLYAQAV